jgi:malonyl-CoA O-methyltransferase
MRPPEEPFFLDRRSARRRFERAVGTFARGDALHREIGSRMHERLDVLRLAPSRILDMGCGPGAWMGPLSQRFPGVPVVGLDFAMGMARAARPPSAPVWRRLIGRAPAAVQAVCGDMAALPFADDSFGLVWSNLALHWLDDPLPALREAQRVLAVGGLIQFSTLGPDTLKELRAASGGGDAHVRRFIDLHDLGDALGRAGFAAPVMDMEVLTLTYESVDGLIADLRATGSTNAMRGRAPGLGARPVISGVRERYEAYRRDGRLPATFEVIYGHAWKTAPRRAAGPAAPAVVNFVPRRK